VEYYDNYADMLNDLSDYSLHAAWLPPLTYIHARQNDLAEVNLLTNHFGTYFTGSQFLAPSNSGITSFFNPEKNINTANAATALRQFQALQPCWVSPTSASGYIVPAGLLAENSIFVADGANLQSHTAVLRALYAGGICDFGATFAISGDPRTSANLLMDYPDILEEMPVIWRSDPIVPNLNLSYHPYIPDDIRTQINLALFSLVSTSAGQQTLSNSLNYDVQDLKFVEENIFDRLTELIEALEIDPQDLIGG
jgi:phosphonate transport system substrate-binding protein